MAISQEAVQQSGREVFEKLKREAQETARQREEKEASRTHQLLPLSSQRGQAQQALGPATAIRQRQRESGSSQG